ncbi:hypothetical protein Maes01_01871 [Microbulbifer aestuariivivens]|uniref:DUF2939 domain-containing protein n=1 Tax=Microbulbifer aestuariivivens TaxID=1908308 RepID=A0ABP9WQ34_9GAMM
MRKWLYTLVTLLLAAYLALPWYTAEQIGRSAAEDDVQRLAGYIDFTALRGNLQASLQQDLRRSMGDDLPPELGDFLSAGSNLLIGPVLRQLVTPEGIAELLRGGDSLRTLQRELYRLGAPSVPEREMQGPEADAWRLLGWRFTAIDRFRADYGPEGNAQLQLILQRQGMQWRVVDLQFLPASESIHK